MKLDYGAAGAPNIFPTVFVLSAGNRFQSAGGLSDG